MQHIALRPRNKAWQYKEISFICSLLITQNSHSGRSNCSSYTVAPAALYSAIRGPPGGAATCTSTPSFTNWRTCCTAQLAPCEVLTRCSTRMDI